MIWILIIKIFIGFYLLNAKSKTIYFIFYLKFNYK